MVSSARLRIADGGIETTLIFHDGLDLPHFAAYDLLTRDGGAEALRRYFDPYAEIARTAGVGIVLETATWRANPGLGRTVSGTARQLAELNGRAVRLLEDVRAEYETASTPIVISGCIGPRGDGYVVGEAMTAEEAEAYHAQQIGTFAETAADLVTAITMTYAHEAVGIVRAATAAALPVVISFTVETDGRLPSGQTLREAIEEVDARDGRRGRVLHDQLRPPASLRGRARAGGAWTDRIRGLRANASKLSHAELDEAEELDEGNPAELASDYVALRDRLPRAPRARRLLRHRPPPRRGDVRSVAQRLARSGNPQKRISALDPRLRRGTP